MTAPGEPVGPPAVPPTPPRAGAPASEPGPAAAPVAAVAPPLDGGPGAVPPGGRIRRLLARIGRPLRSRRGVFVLFVLIAGAASAVTVGGVVAIQWTETADFCGRCHTMGPELKAHANSPHSEVACAECHVAPGLDGWVAAKLNGTKQLIQLLTGTYPTPIPPPGHGDLPPTSATCLRCHDVGPLVANGGLLKLILDTRYRSDETNTRDVIALVIRPAGFGDTTATRGVHWHIDSDVEYTTSDPRAQKIDLVRITNKDGTQAEYIGSGQVGLKTNVQPDVDRLLATETTRRMDCIDCHNRVGHAVPTLDAAVDNALEAGRIDAQLPYIKREAMVRLAASYATNADAERVIDALRGFYAVQYPLVAQAKAGAINAAIGELTTIYQLVATPEMRVTAATYPDNLGHQAAPGCFRCHDGAHYKVVNGAVTGETIPSACATCHTFPQIGSVEAGIVIGQRPSSHLDRLWVFDHKNTATAVDPAGQTCGTCHTRTYCENCHNTPAVNVTHDDMLFNHAAVVRKAGAAACAFCHQAAYCEQCHASGVLPNPYGVTPNPSPSP